VLFRSPVILGARVKPDGQVLDVPPFHVSDRFRGALRAAVAFDGANYFVVWEGEDAGGPAVLGTRVTPGGLVLDPNEIVISRHAPSGMPTIAFDGSDYLVAWADDRNGYQDIYATRVSPGGTVLDPIGIPIATAPQTQNAPRVAFGGENFLVVWQDWRPDCCAVYGARVSRAGVVLDQRPITISPFSGGVERAPTVAYDGKDYVVAWTQRSSEDVDVYGARVSRAGVALDPSGILLSTSRPPPPAVRCVVPKVAGLRLTLAKGKIRRAHCSVGAVRRKRTRRARPGVVLAQKPNARVIRRRGYPVRLIVNER